MSDPLFFDNDKERKSGFTQKIKSFNPRIISILSFCMLIIIALSIWAFYPSKEIDPDSLPIIEAKKEPLRIKPDSAEITDNTELNSRIYETFGNESQPRKIENLLRPQADTEEPVTREDLFAGLKTESENGQKQSKVISITESPFAETQEDTTLEESEPEEETATASQEQNNSSLSSEENSSPGIFENAKSEKEEEIASSEDTQNIEKTEPAAGVLTNTPDETPPQKFESGNYYVQLASIQDESRTTESWKKLTEKHGLLKEVSYRTQSAQIEGKGTFYRIQAGPLSKKSANSLCEQIKAQSGSCFVTSK